MKILNTFKAKFGSGGKRNRAKRRREIRRGHVTVTQEQHSSLPDDLCNEDFGLTGAESGVLNVPAIIQNAKLVELDLTGVWDEKIASMAIAMFEESGKSQRAFCAEHGFSDSKLRSWKKKLESQVA